MNQQENTYQRSVKREEGLEGVKVSPEAQNRLDELSCIDGRKQVYLMGAKHHQWKGSLAHPNSQRERARTRFKNIGQCELCKIKKACDRHHVNGDTNNNLRSNIMFLCRSCHMKTDGRMLNLLKASKAQKKLHPKPCINCKKLYKPLRKNMCVNCYCKKLYHEKKLNQ